MRFLLHIGLAALASMPALPSAHATEVEPVEALSAVFATAGVTGTFAVLDPDRDRVFVHDAVRAAIRFIPASTFKIAHTLIALDGGAISSVDEIFPWDGAPRGNTAWEADMPFRDAIRLSNVTVFQQVARRVGLARMQDGLRRLGYGNADPGMVVDTFWLRGPLEISALEQVDFLRRLARRELPFPSAVMAATRDIIRLETRDGATLYGKTGWGTASTPPIGWFVGWVEREGRCYPFALNIDMPGIELAPVRREVARACLQRLKIWPE